MTTRNRIILLVAVVILGALLLACSFGGDEEARLQWQSEVLSRQRGIERPTEEVPE